MCNCTGKLEAPGYQYELKENATTPSPHMQLQHRPVTANPVYTPSCTQVSSTATGDHPVVSTTTSYQVPLLQVAGSVQTPNTTGGQANTLRGPVLDRFTALGSQAPHPQWGYNPWTRCYVYLPRPNDWVQFQQYYNQQAGMSNYQQATRVCILQLYS